MADLVAVSFNGDALTFERNIFRKNTFLIITANITAEAVSTAHWTCLNTRDGRIEKTDRHTDRQTHTVTVL